MDSVEFKVLERIATVLEKQECTLGHIYDELQTMNCHLDNLESNISDIPQAIQNIADMIDLNPVAPALDKLANTIRQKDFTCE